MSSSLLKPSPIIPRGALPRFQALARRVERGSGGRPGVMTCDGRYQADDRSFRALVIIRRRARNVLIRPPGPSRRTVLNPWRTARVARRSRRVDLNSPGLGATLLTIRELATIIDQCVDQLFKTVASHFEQFVAVQSQLLDRGLAMRVIVDRGNLLFVELQESRWIFCRGMNEQGLFLLDVVVVRVRSLRCIHEREMVALETLVAKLTGVQEVRPFVG